MPETAPKPTATPTAAPTATPTAAAEPATTMPSLNESLRVTLKAAYDKTSAAIQELEDKIGEVVTQNAARRAELESQIGALQEKIYAIERLISHESAGIHILIDAEKAKLNFLSSQASKLMAPPAPTAAPAASATRK